MSCLFPPLTTNLTERALTRKLHPYAGIAILIRSALYAPIFAYSRKQAFEKMVSGMCECRMVHFSLQRADNSLPSQTSERLSETCFFILSTLTFSLMDTPVPS